ncbi:hypothetical protein D3C87_1533190 [compost metagenome]
MFGFHVADLAADQLQLGRQLLDALGEGVAGTLQFVLSGFHLRQLFQLVAFLGAQGLRATEVFQGFLCVQHLLVQRFGLGLARGAVGGHGLLGLELLEFFVQAFLLVAQCCAVSQGLQCRRFDVGDVDGQARHFEAFAFEAVEDQLHGFHPVAVFVEGDAVFA